MKRKALLLINVVLALLMVFSSVSFAFTSVPVKSISLNKTSLTLAAGKTATLTALISPKNATNKVIIWSSSDNKIAKVNAKGVVTAVKAGKATITAKSKDGKATAKCIVTISQVAKLPVVNLTISQYAVKLDDTDGIAKDRIKKLLEDKFKIRITWHSGFDGYFDKLKVALMAGNAPDLFHNWGEPDQISQWSKDGLLTDIGELVSKDTARYPVLNLMFKSPIYKMYNDYYTGDSNNVYAIYGLMYRKWVVGIPVYNAKIFKEANLKIPETIDEFIAVGKELKKKGITLWYPENAKLTYWDEIDRQIFSTMGGNVFGFFQDKNGNWYDGAITNKTKNCWKLVSQMYKDGIIDKEIGTKGDYDQATADFVTGKIAAINLATNAVTQYAWLYNKFKEAHPDVKPEDLVLTAPLKGTDGYVKNPGIPLSIGVHWFIPKTCKYPDRVLDLINYISSDEGQKLIFLGIKDVHYFVGPSGNIVFNKEEWDKEDGAYGITDGRCTYPYFRLLVNPMQQYVQFEKAGDWVKGIMGAQSFDDERYGKKPEYLYARPISKKNEELTYIELPSYLSIVKLTDEENQIKIKLNEIVIKYGSAFLVGQKDVDKEWNSFIKEYKAAGGDKLLQSYASKVAKAKKKYEEYQK